MWTIILNHQSSKTNFPPSSFTLFCNSSNCNSKPLDVITKCIICGDKAEDVHHIAHQSTSDKDGFIGHFHKNHKHNLVPLCKKHHKDIHDKKIKIENFVMTSKGLELQFEELQKSVKEEGGKFVLDDW